MRVLSLTVRRSLPLQICSRSSPVSSFNLDPFQAAQSSRLSASANNPRYDTHIAAVNTRRFFTSTSCTLTTDYTTASMSPPAEVPAAIKEPDNKPIVISGPSGSGKSTLLKRLFEKYPDRFAFSVSHTTRSPRPGEQDGKDYNFTTREKFQSIIEKDGFIENAQFGSNLYGTSFATVESIQATGRRCILDIEMEGVKQIHKSHLKCRFLFLQPPSLEILEQRLRGRGTDKEEDVLKRLEAAGRELEYAKTPGVHDKIVVNDDLETAWAQFEAFCLDLEQ